MALANRRGRGQGSHTEGLQTIGLAGPDKVAFAVNGSNCTINAPFRGELAEIAVSGPRCSTT